MEKYAYQQLGQIEKVIYDEMLSAILDQEEAVPLSTTDADVMQKAYKAVCSDYGGLFWVDGYSCWLGFFATCCDSSLCFKY